MKMKRARHVLVLSTALSGGGAEAVARLMVEGIDGTECLLFENDAGIKVAGCNIRTIPRPSLRGFLGKCLVNIWRVAFIQCVKFRVRPEVTISHLEGPNFANLLTWWSGRRIIFVHNRVSHNYHQGRLVDRIKTGLVRRLYHRAEKVFCVSSDICLELTEDFGVPVDRVDILPNPIDTEKIKKSSHRTYGDARDYLCEQNYLINVASLTHQKNQELLLRAFSELTQASTDNSDLKLVLVGEGEEEHRLQNLCSGLGLKTTAYDVDEFDLSAKVFFMGFQSNPYALLRRARLHVMPSLWEGLPVALLEAMALGVPSIVANCSAAVRDIFGWSAEERLQLNSQTFVRTPIGVLVTGQVIGDEPASVNLWTDLISQTLTDTDYLRSCRGRAVERVAQNDLSRVKSLWRAKMLCQ